MYYIMHKDFAAPLTDLYPSAAQYDNKELILIGEMPKGFDGEIVRINEMDITNEELSVLVDKLRVEEHTGKLVITTIAQGEWLYDNHEAFKPNEDTQWR